MMEVIAEQGNEELAKIYVASMRGSSEYLVEFVESIQPPIPREKKWVLIVSTLFGCPIKCKMCDAGGTYRGKLTKDEILEEIDFMVKRRFPDRNIPISKFKIQFARMGDPFLNIDVINVLEQLPHIYDAPGLIPSISTVAPKNTFDFFNKLTEVKNRYYSDGKFQLQFSIHTSDLNKRNELIPIKKMDFSEIAQCGNKFYQPGDQKITLNFAMGKGYPVDAGIIRKFFNPEYFIIKLTPINPTESAKKNNIISEIDASDPTSADHIVNDFKSEGFDVILSIGEQKENYIGSNCGQFITQIMDSKITSIN